MPDPTTLDALYGRLCRLSEELAKPATPEAAKRQIHAEIGQLMSRRPALIERSRQQAVTTNPFPPSGKLRDDLTAIAAWCLGIARKAEMQGNDALAATAPRITEEINRALEGRPLAYAAVDESGQADLAEIVGYLRDRGLGRAS